MDCLSLVSIKLVLLVFFGYECAGCNCFVILWFQQLKSFNDAAVLSLKNVRHNFVVTSLSANKT